MEKIIAQVQAWDLLSKLPKQFAGLELIVNLQEKDTQYWIFTYENKKWRKSFSVLYDTATKEFLARTIIGLTEYYDVNFIVSDIGMLEKLLVKRLEKTLTNLAVYDRGNLDSIVTDKKILEWPYGKELPQELAGFELFIKPCEPVKIINGSYIIVDYSDFCAESNLIIYYNIFRDEFFGEARIRRTPQMSAVFDSDNLDGLQTAMTTHLRPVLENIRNQLK